MTTKPIVSLRQRALGYLARREHSRQELLLKLQPHTEVPEELDALLEDLQKRGWLSDERYAEQVVHARRSRYGSLKVAHLLREKGVSETTAENAVKIMAKTDLASARNVWQKKFGNRPSSREEWAKQARFLQSRGFGFEVIKQVLNDAPEEFEST